MSKLEPIRKRAKTGGRQKGTPNRVSADLRQALRSLAEGNAPRVQQWLDSVSENDPGEAIRLWLTLLRYVTPTLQAAAHADLTPRSAAEPEQLHRYSDEELMAMITTLRAARVTAPNEIFGGGGYTKTGDPTAAG